MSSPHSLWHIIGRVLAWVTLLFAVGTGAIQPLQALVDFKTVEEYINWMTGFCETTAPGGSYVLHSSCFDDAARTAIFFATYTLTHTGEGGPIPPTIKQPIPNTCIYSR
jgi:hypothetical protein